ncbi:MAG TPA: glycoside hydrolase family 88 protein [Pseudonocardia sp.]|nr:glycoside hydrolase family 88 protein [Pseudonocardia sp.]
MITFAARPGRRLRVAAVTVMTVVALVACGGTGAGPPPAAAPDPGRLDALAADALAVAQDRLAGAADRLDPEADGYPRSTGPDGRWETRDPDDWTSGFFAGTLWMLHEQTGDPAWRDRAQRWTVGIAGEADRTDTHDLGFMIGDSFGHQLRLTGDPAAREVLLQASESLATRFDPEVGALKSWDTAEFDEDRRGTWQFPVIIDNMMNLEMLYLAAREPGGDPRWAEIATEHAVTSSQHHLRPDGSTAHVALFDPESGEFLRQETWQGLAPESTWSRGQAWAVHGFTDAHRESGRPELLAAAQRAADWYVAALPEDHVPYWDFDAPDVPDAERDSSAAAIAASGLYELARLTGGERGATYRAAADATLATLAQSYLADAAGSDALLAHGVGFLPEGSEVDVGLVYGDHYFVEALTRSGQLG